MDMPPSIWQTLDKHGSAIGWLYVLQAVQGVLILLLFLTR